tara:strand:- start:375 stop:551 length:177 start_codon:yes stop_codon:yes gene_type:complete
MENRATLKLDLNELKYLQELLSKDAFMPECFGDLRYCIACGIHDLEWQKDEYTWTNQE